MKLSHSICVLALLALAEVDAAHAQPGDDAPQLCVATRRFGGSDLILLDVTGKNITRLTKDLGDVNEPCWHPDGKRLALVVTANGSGLLKLFDIESGKVTSVGSGPNDRGPVWSPDGKKLLFTSDRKGAADLFVMDADGSNIVALTNDNGFDADPAWSPDGKKIAFTSNRTGRFRLYLMNSDGSDVTDVLKQDLVYSVYPCWSPDGQQIAFGGRGNDGSIQLCVVNADGQGLQQLSEGAQMNTYAAWSPDGQYIAYGRFNTMRVGDNSAGKGDLMLYDSIAGTHAKLLADELPIIGPRPAWKP